MKYTANVIHFTQENGGRHCGFNAGYCPHLLIAGRPIMLAMRVISVNGSAEETLEPGKSAIVIMDGLYDDELKYDISIGNLFSLMEGPRKIGEGSIMDIS
jgi:hypothetical protein